MEKSRKEKNEELASFWKSQLEQWSESELSGLEYCKQHDLIYHRFIYWKKKFDRQNLPVEFVQIPDSMPIELPGLKLNIGSNFQIEISDNFSQATLERVLATLGIFR